MLKTDTKRGIQKSFCLNFKALKQNSYHEVRCLVKFQLGCGNSSNYGQGGLLGQYFFNFFSN